MALNSSYGTKSDTLLTAHSRFPVRMRVSAMMWDSRAICKCKSRVVHFCAQEQVDCLLYIVMAATKFVRVGYANMHESNKDLLLGSTSSVVKKNSLVLHTMR